MLRWFYCTVGAYIVVRLIVGPEEMLSLAAFFGGLIGACAGELI